MKRVVRVITLLICILLVFSCSKRKIVHIGSRDCSEKCLKWETIDIKPDTISISWNGNFFISMGRLCFADTYYCRLYQFDIESGHFIGMSLGKGHANNEIPDFMYAYPVKNHDELVCFINSSMYMHVFNNRTSKIERKGKIDFGWENIESDNYDSPSIYGIMELTDFGIDIYETENHKLLFPLSMVDRSIKNPRERFSKGKIWGVFDSEKFKIEKVFGNYPPIYEDVPTPGFNFFSYSRNDSLYYVSHAIDSMIYVRNSSGEMIHSFGYDCPIADRKYSKSKDIFESATFEKDLEHVSLNTGLDYIPETNMIIRTICLNMQEPRTCVQVYDAKTFNLVNETHVNGVYRYLTYRDGKYIGINLYSDENRSIYSFTIE